METNVPLGSGPELVGPLRCAPAMDSGTLSTVLHVEDDPNDALLLSLAFRKARVSVQLQHVADGREAVHYLSGSAPYFERHRFPLPGLVLLDLKMPNLDGFGVLAWARTQARLIALPIIVLSSSEQPEDVSRAKGLRADRYIVKTSGYAEVISAVQDYLKGAVGCGLKLQLSACLNLFAGFILSLARAEWQRSSESGRRSPAFGRFWRALAQIVRGSCSLPGQETS